MLLKRTRSSDMLAGYGALPALHTTALVVIEAKSPETFSEAIFPRVYAECLAMMKWR